MADWPTDREQGSELQGREADRGAEGVLAPRSPPGLLALEAMPTLCCNCPAAPALLRSCQCSGEVGFPVSQDHS